MENKYFDSLAAVEDTHWYHQNARKLVTAYLDDVRRVLPPHANILEIGCGTGGMISPLRKYGTVTGLELSPYALKICRKKHPDVRLINGSANNLSLLFKKNSFDLIAIFNVMYHQWIDNDVKLLTDAFSLLRSPGLILLYEPALMVLYRENDRLCSGVRRYTRKQMSAKAEAAGFEIISATYFNSVSVLPLLLLKCLEQLVPFNQQKNHLELRPPPGYLNLLLSQVMTGERWWIKTFGAMPLGVSVLYLGIKQ